MMKFGSEENAKKEAKAKNLFYGWSIFSSGWYVGTKEQLIKIGVLDPIN